MGRDEWNSEYQDREEWRRERDELIKQRDAANRDQQYDQARLLQSRIDDLRGLIDNSLDRSQTEGARRDPEGYRQWKDRVNRPQPGELPPNKFTNRDLVAGMPPEPEDPTFWQLVWRSIQYRFGWLWGRQR